VLGLSSESRPSPLRVLAPPALCRKRRRGVVTGGQSSRSSQRFAPVAKTRAGAARPIRSDQETLISPDEIARGRAAHALEVPQGAIDEAVIPAANMEHRDVDIGVACFDLSSGPVIVLDLVVHPLEVKRRDAGTSDEGLLAQWSKRVVVGRCAQGGGELCFQFRTKSAREVASQLERPAQGEREREGTAVVEPAFTHLRGSEGRDDSLQPRWLLRCGEELEYARIGEAIHPNAAIGPGLSGRPRHRIGAIGGLRDQRIEHARGGPTAADVLDDDGIAARGVPGGVGIENRLCQPPIVGQAQEEHGPAPSSLGPVDIGGQRCVVAETDSIGL
jgi:hypothetical protein